MNEPNGPHYTDWATLPTLYWLSYPAHTILTELPGPHYTDWATRPTLYWLSYPVHIILTQLPGPHYNDWATRPTLYWLSYPAHRKCLTRTTVKFFSVEIFGEELREIFFQILRKIRRDSEIRSEGHSAQNIWSHNSSLAFYCYGNTNRSYCLPWASAFRVEWQVYRGRTHVHPDDDIPL